MSSVLGPITGAIAAILLPRTTPQLYLAQLAVLRSGGAFACIDPGFPDSQVQEGVPKAQDGEVVLAVEDDDTVRQIAVDALKDLGYTVYEAPNGRSALELLRQQPRIDLLFTDFAMPGGLNGRDLALEAVAQRPALKVLLTSAYTERLSADGRPHPALRFLSKPYREGELATAVRAALDER